MSKKPKKLSDQLRDAIENANMTRYRMAQDLDIDESQLSRFVHKKCGLSIVNIDAIGEYLGLEITTAAKSRKGKGR